MENGSAVEHVAARSTLPVLASTGSPRRASIENGWLDLPDEAALGTSEKLNQQGCSRQLANHYLGRRWWIQLVLLLRLPVVVASCPEFNIFEKEEEVFSMTE